MSQHASVSRRLHRPLGLLAASAVALSLAACGGGSGTADAKGSASTSSGGGAPASVTVLRSTGSTFEPLYIAEDQGFFKDENLTVTIKPGAQDTSQNAPSVLNNEAQFAMTDSSGFIKAAAAGLPMQIVSGLQSSTTTFEASDGLVVPADSAIKSFKDVEGKTIALPALGGTLQYICEYSAEKAGADPSKIKFVALPLPSLVDAVKSGQADGAYLFATFLDAARTAGLTVIGQGTNALPGLPQALLFSSKQYLSANKDVAARFVSAVSKAIDYANAHPDDVRAVDTKYTQLPADYIANRKIQPFNATIDTSSFGTIVKGMTSYGLIDKKPTGDLVWSGAPTGTIK